jgi:hypothetical protein
MDEHIEIKIPEARARENRLMAQTNFVQHVNEKSRNPSHNHLAVENGIDIPRNNLPESKESKPADKHQENKDPNMHRSHSHASMKRVHGLNGVGHAAHGIEHKNSEHRIKK